MNIDLRNNLKIDTNYNFKVYRDDVLIREENTHNIICNYFFQSSPKSVYLAIGSGTGTPAATDNTLFSFKWSINSGTNTVTSGKKTDTSNAWVQVSKQYTIPASASYVGTITECGLSANSNGTYLLTHALLLDSEGNPISIDKTDLDVIIVTVVIRVNLIDTDTVKFDDMPGWSAFVQSFANGTSLSYCITRNLEVLWSAKSALSGMDAHFWKGGSYGGMPYYYSTMLSSSINPSGYTYATETRRLTISGARLGTDFPNPGQHFIKGLRVGNTFIVPFPNTDVFPAYTISGMEVGTGDGETTEFTCPMNYFVENTDVVYVDGVAMTRGVDYTLEHDNNNQACPTLMHSNEATITGGVCEGSGTRYQYRPIFRGCAFSCKPSGYSYGSFDYYRDTNIYGHATQFNTSAPLFLDFGEPKKTNYFQIGAPYSYGSKKYTLLYSTDGEEYTEATSVLKTTNAAAIATFDTITARYWKVTIAYTESSSSADSSRASIVYGSGSDVYGLPTNYVADTDLCQVGYKGHGIQFTNPPAAGAVITMDAQTDLPMKNSNFVFDADITVTF